MIEKTLVLIKPDGVQRCLVGKIIQRFEDSGLKIIGMKMQWIDKEFAKQHYTQDVAERRGEKVREVLLDFITEGPVVAMCIEGIKAIENVRKITGTTEPKAAAPGTIRGDFAHVSFSYADNKEIAVKNIIHASADQGDAETEIKLWFKPEEMHSFKTVHDTFIL
ncbi:MAG: nucleoside-diphosphate kinase [Nanoarchaeota archaeon]|nr:nucleoside-diphosphate kinase [Nanoarchaeota archaeon]MCK5629071.1 nucleoside-diphosphate kinase [Nanoarchaeota archaeon]